MVSAASPLHMPSDFTLNLWGCYRSGLFFMHNNYYGIPGYWAIRAQGSNAGPFLHLVCQVVSSPWKKGTGFNLWVCTLKSTYSDMWRHSGEVITVSCHHKHSSPASPPVPLPSQKHLHRDSSWTFISHFFTLKHSIKSLFLLSHH